MVSKELSLMSFKDISSSGARKFSQEKLAEIANLNRNFIGMIERGETNVTVKNLESIANALQMNIKDLFDFRI